MREQISTIQRADIGVQTRLSTWMRRRLFRSIHIGIFLSTLAAVGIHCHYVFAQQGQPKPVQQQPSSQLAPMSSVLAAAAANASSSTATTQPAAPATVTTAPAAPEPKAALALPATDPLVQHAVIHTGAADEYVVVEKRQETIPFKKVIQLSRSGQPGHTSAGHKGENGLVEKTFRVTYKGVTPIKYSLESTRVIKKVVDETVLASYTSRAARALPSRSGIYMRSREIDMVATGYSPYEGSGSGRCATGIRAGYGVVAVDPRVIPLGSKLYVSGYGYALAGDTGGAIKGRRIDLGQNTYSAAYRVGRRHVHVYVLGTSR